MIQKKKEKEKAALKDVTFLALKDFAFLDLMKTFFNSYKLLCTTWRSLERWRISFL